MNFPWFEFAGLMLAFGINVVIPGADFAMVLRQSIAYGRRAGICTAAGVATAILVHGTYTLLGVGLIVGQSILAFNVIKTLGVLYLLWLGISALRAAPPAAPDVAGAKDGKQISDFAAYGLGFLTNLLNPKAVLFFLALFTTLVSAATPGPVKIVYLGSMSAMLLIWFAMVAIFFTMPSVRQGFFKLGRWFNRVTGITFILLALRVAVARQA